MFKPFMPLGLLALLFAPALSAEPLFLSERLGINTEPSALFEVNLDNSGIAQLTALPALAECDLDNDGEASIAECPSSVGGPGEVPIIRLVAMALTPDGNRLYLADSSDFARLGYYDLEFLTQTGTGRWVQTGNITDESGMLVLGSVQAAFSANGDLYIVSGITEQMYLVDPQSAAATSFGNVLDSATLLPLDISGADIAFDADGQLWLWNNPEGLFSIEIDQITGQVIAELVGNFSVNDTITGLVFADNGNGNPLASALGSDAIFELDLDSETVIGQFQASGDLLDLTAGDMASGVVSFCGNRTIGYYKTHMYGPASDILNDVELSMCSGNLTLDALQMDAILKHARGKNISMLIAQFIGAKLNCDFAGDGLFNNNCGISGYTLIETAENFICNLGSVNQGDVSGPGWWKADFADRAEKAAATDIARQLDEFNNFGHDSFECKVQTVGCLKDIDDGRVLNIGRGGDDDNDCDD